MYPLFVAFLSSSLTTMKLFNSTQLIALCCNNMSISQHFELFKRQSKVRIRCLYCTTINVLKPQMMNSCWPANALFFIKNRRRSKADED